MYFSTRKLPWHFEHIFSEYKCISCFPLIRQWEPRELEMWDHNTMEGVTKLINITEFLKVDLLTDTMLGPSKQFYSKSQK